MEKAKSFLVGLITGLIYCIIVAMLVGCGPEVSGEVVVIHRMDTANTCTYAQTKEAYDECLELNEALIEVLTK